MFTRGWLDAGLPGEDFAGNVAWVWELRRAIFGSGDFSGWCPQWFLGNSRALISSKLLSFLIPVPFTFLGPVASIKAALVLFHILSGIGMFYFVRYLTGRAAAGFAAALCYCLNPMYIIETAMRGHLEVSLLYAFVPPLFHAYTKTLREESTRAALVTGLLLALCLWVNNEGSLVTLPFLLAVLSSEAYRRWLALREEGKAETTKEALLQTIGPLARLSGIVMLVGICLSLFFIVPAMAERRYHHLFPPGYTDRALETFSYRNPLYLIDRDGAVSARLGALPEPMRVFPGQLYVGLMALLLAACALAVRDRTVRGIAGAYLALFAAAFSFSFGKHSIWDSLLALSPVKGLQLLGSFILFLAPCGVILVLWLRGFDQLKQISKAKWKLISLAAVVSFFLFTPTFAVLRAAVPFYTHSRSSLWFFMTPGVFGICVLVGLGVLVLERIPWMKFRLAVFGVLLLLILLDFSPYTQRFFDQIPESEVKELASAYQAVGREAGSFRSLGIESYNPLVDMGAIYSDKPLAWAWLNWDATKGSGEYIFGNVYPLLWSPDEAQRVRGAQLAGLANVRYILDDLGEPPDVQPCEMIQRHGSAGRFAVYENLAWRPFVSVHGARALYVGPADSAFYSISAFLAARNVALEQADIFNPDSARRYDYVFWNVPGAAKLDFEWARQNVPGVQFYDMARRDRIAVEHLFEGDRIKQWTRERSGEIRIDLEPSAKTTGTQVVRVSESWYPYWHAYVDGRKQPTVRCFGTFLSVVAPKGTRQVVFRYETPWYYGTARDVSWLLFVAWWCGMIALSRRGRSWAKGMRQLLRPGDAVPKPTFAKDESPAFCDLLRAHYVRWDFAACLVIFILALIVYILTLAPTVTAEDSGELVAAAATLGIPHPPGYPLFVVLGKLATLLPFGRSPAYHVTVMTAFFGAGTLILLFLLLRLAIDRTIVALGWVLVMMGTVTLWSQSVVAEVYTINSFFTLLALLCLLFWAESKKTTLLLAFGVTYGLNVVAHYMSIALAPAYIAFIFWTDPHLIYRKSLLGLAAMLLVGLSPMLLPFFFARHDPPLNWGNPDTIKRWLYHIRRVQYRGLEFEEIIPTKEKMQFIGNFIWELMRQFPFYVAWLAGPGLVWLWRKERRITVLTVTLFVFNGIVLTLGLHFRYNEVNVLRVQVYYIPAYLAFCVWLAAGWQWLLETQKVGGFLTNRRVREAALTAAPFVLAAGLLVLNWRENDMSKYYFAQDYAENIFATAAPRAILYPIGDQQTFPIAYFQAVEGKRPDIIIADTYGYLNDAVLDEYAKVTGESPEGRSREAIERAVMVGSKRPIYYFQRRDMPEGKRLQPEGILFRVASTEEEWFGPVEQREIERINRLWASYRIRGVFGKDARLDWMAQSICASYYAAWGEWCFETGEVEAGLKAFERAAAVTGDAADELNNLGSSLAERGFLVEAERYLFRARDREPERVSTWKNLGLVQERLGKLDLAYYVYADGVREFPQDEELRIRYETIKARFPEGHPKPPHIPTVEEITGGSSSETVVGVESIYGPRVGESFWELDFWTTRGKAADE
jgi:tetratricopeptide (TPR) repeat protein